MFVSDYSSTNRDLFANSSIDTIKCQQELVQVSFLLGHFLPCPGLLLNCDSLDAFLDVLFSYVIDLNPNLSVNLAEMKIKSTALNLLGSMLKHFQDTRKSLSKRTIKFITKLVHKRPIPIPETNLCVDIGRRVANDAFYSYICFVNILGSFLLIHKRFGMLYFREGEFFNYVFAGDEFEEELVRKTESVVQCFSDCNLENLIKKTLENRDLINQKRTTNKNKSDLI